MDSYYGSFSEEIKLKDGVYADVSVHYHRQDCEGFSDYDLVDVTVEVIYNGDTYALDRDELGDWREAWDEIAYREVRDNLWHTWELWDKTYT